MGALTSKRKEPSLEGEEIGFDHFQVLRAIGKGSFGKVCIVQKRDSKQMFAMKYMNKAQCEARDALSNVFREIEILASLNHPFLVNLWFSFQDSEDMFMVVDLLLGGDLRYHVQQGVQFSDHAVRLYVLEVAAALSYLHARNIIHRDIKPDNLLLDEEGHVHLTDFNIATVLRPGQLATSMSGTKPYMAPEVFECVADTCEGYGYEVDWWSLGVTAYEVRRGKRPYDIHSNTSLHEIRLMFLQVPTFPSCCHPGLVHVISRLLTVTPGKRITRVEELTQIPYAAAVSMEEVMNKDTKPAFTPPKDHLNCDPTFELEEMIIESRPLHKKKKRLSKQKSIRETQSSISGTTETEAVVYKEMLVFNREQEEARKERERREQEWQAELEESMKMSDPTGHGCNFTGSNTSTPVKRRSKSHKESIERRHKEEHHHNQETRAVSSPSTSSSVTSLLVSPTERTPLPKIAVSPSNVKARIAGSPKVKVRGTTVTIESPRSSSSLTKSSTQQLKERLKELKADQHRHGDSASDTECSDVTQSDDLTLTGRRSPSKSPSRSQTRSRSASPERSGSKSPERPQRRSASKSSERSPKKSPAGSHRASGSRSPDRSQKRSSSKSPGRSQRRSASGSPKRSQRKSSSGSSRRSPGRSSKKGAGKTPRKDDKHSSNVPQDDSGAQAAVSSSPQQCPPTTSSVAQDISRRGDPVISRPVSLPAAVHHDFQQFSSTRISAPPLTSSATRSNSRESDKSNQDPKVLKNTDKSTENRKTRDSDKSLKSRRPSKPTDDSAQDRPTPQQSQANVVDQQNVVLSNGCLTSTKISGKSPAVPDFTLESQVPERKITLAERRRRHSMEPRKKSTERSKRLSEGHRSSSVSSKTDLQSLKNSFEHQETAPEPPEARKKSSVTKKRNSRVSQHSLEIEKNASDTGCDSPEVGKKPSVTSKRHSQTSKNSLEVQENMTETSSNSPDVREESSVSRKTDAGDCSNSTDIQELASQARTTSSLPSCGKAAQSCEGSSDAGMNSGEGTENPDEAPHQTSEESLRRSLNERKQDSSVTHTTISCRSSEDSSDIQQTLPDIPRGETRKSSSESHESGNDASDEGIEMTC